MKVGKVVLRFVTGAAPIIAALAMAAPPTTLAAVPSILVDADNPATDCGSFTGKASVADPAVAINTAVTGSTIIICPGIYDLSNEIGILDKTLTIKRAVTSGTSSRPVLTIDGPADRVMQIQSSTVTIDGLILDAKASTDVPYRAINAAIASVTIKNTTILGPDLAGSIGINSTAINSDKQFSLSISNSTILGYRDTGVHVAGAVKLNMTSSHVDASDGGRVDNSVARGVFFGGGPGPIGPTGTVSKSRVLNNAVGIRIDSSNKVSVTSNMLVGNGRGVQISGSTIRNTDNNKVIGNTITGIKAGNMGVFIEINNAAVFTIHKFAVSKNVIVADQYGSTAAGIRVISNVPQTLNTSGSITSNTFVGMPDPIQLMNGPFPLVKVSGNDAQP